MEEIQREAGAESISQFCGCVGGAKSSKGEEGVTIPGVY